ncbi:MAG: M20/M25/M40 family metallo-hydrolase [Fusicatenibacter sp.]|nr:M20/M25/M40 family metallo-hydrolase [Fusicatenibacter sp.]
MRITEKFREFCRENLKLMEKTLEELSEISSFTGEEKTRAEYCRAWLESHGVNDVFRDEAGNVVWRYQKESEIQYLFTAHLDTVFPAEIPRKVKKEGTIWSCPGIGDNTVHVMLLMMGMFYLSKSGQRLPYGLILALDTEEEGLGNLSGCRKLMDTYGSAIQGVLVLDLYRDKLYTKCVGSIRYKIEVSTMGGHSYLDFGRKNAIAELSELIGELYDLPTGSSSHTTCNVGTIRGGTSVNTIAAKAEMLFEYRSDSYLELKACEERMQRILKSRQSKEVMYSCLLLGKRPCAEGVDADKLSELAELCREIVEEFSGTVPEEADASTDCNIPLSLGIPSVCVGLCRGAGAHTEGEWLDISTLSGGLSGLLALLCSLPL